MAPACQARGHRENLVYWHGGGFLENLSDFLVVELSMNMTCKSSLVGDDGAKR